MNMRRAVRKAIMTKLKNDTTLQTMVGNPVPVRYRPSRNIGTFSSTQKYAITFFDQGDRADETVPLDDRNYQFDVWTTLDLDAAEDVCERLEQLLDGEPLPLSAEPATEGLVAFFRRQQDFDNTDDDADVTRKTLIFRMLVYEYGVDPSW